MAQEMNPNFDWLLKTNEYAAAAFNCGLPRDMATEHVAVTLGLQVVGLEERVKELESIAPKKVRQPNGEIVIWRCPDHLIPEP